jgi:hypothetical protein
VIRAAFLLALLMPLPAYAQAPATVPASEDAGVKAIADTLPATLGGMSREVMDVSTINPGAVSIIYRSDEGIGPSIGIVVHRTAAFDWTVMRDGVRRGYEGPFFQIVREGTFSVPGKPEAQTFFGEYSTQMGLRQIWKLRSDGIEISVLVIIFRKEDREPMLKVIANDFFGGAVFVSGPPASAAAN